MTFFNNKHKKCTGCICHILDNSEIFITDGIFHDNICFLHYKYIKDTKNNIDADLYEKTGRNYFVNIVEYNIDKQKIRDATVCYLVSYIKMFFNNLE